MQLIVDDKQQTRKAVDNGIGEEFLLDEFFCRLLLDLDFRPKPLPHVVQAIDDMHQFIRPGGALLGSRQGQGLIQPADLEGFGVVDNLIDVPVEQADKEEKDGKAGDKQGQQLGCQRFRGGIEQLVLGIGGRRGKGD
ncbi:MAG: hypothetical protein ACD_75C00167G0002 [uncultured bacterium]|nr:MAG: hypothetical protein ACD_75C00167G0002 [uncultured bacterium]